MEHDSKIAGEIKAQITFFAHKISFGLKKPLKKFIVQMLYGIQASKDVKLSNIARSLNEKIPLLTFLFIGQIRKNVIVIKKCNGLLLFIVTVVFIH